jgi:hypothetical protein
MDTSSEDDAFVLALIEAMSQMQGEPSSAYQAAFITVMGSGAGVFSAEGNQRVLELDRSEKIRQEEGRIRRARYLFGQLRLENEDTRELMADLVTGKPLVF